MRSYREMFEVGDWPPTNRETIFFILALLLGGFIGFVLGKL